MKINSPAFVMASDKERKVIEMMRLKVQLVAVDKALAVPLAQRG